MAYLAAMTLGLVLSGLLFLIPSKRHLAWKYCLAIILSLPGVFAFQFVVGIFCGILIAADFGFNALLHPPEWVQGIIGIPIVLIIFGSVTAASFLGCYTGGRIGWLLASGTSFRAAVAEQKKQRVIQVIKTWWQKRTKQRQKKP